MAKVTDIINLALRDAGVIGAGQVASAEDTQDALTTLNQMIAMWRTERLAVYCLKDVSVTVTGAQSYTIGTGGAFNVTRPVEVVGAFWRSLGLDYPIRVLNAFEDYQSIGTKTLPSGGPPDYLYYRPNYPLGEVLVWPQPASGEIHLTVMADFPVYVGVSDDVALPPEYEGAIRFNLAVILAAMFGSQLRADIAQLAKTTKRAIKRINASIPIADMPAAVLPYGRYNINADRVV